ncbi:helix-turn-helix domain-containing protein [Pseudoalteromonas xiamenensis]
MDIRSQSLSASTFQSSATPELTVELTKYLHQQLTPIASDSLTIEVAEDNHKQLVYGHSPSAINQPICSFPIMYQRRQVGALNLFRRQVIKSLSQEHLHQISKAVAFLIQRNSTHHRCDKQLGRTLPLIGFSDAIFQLDSQIERAASARYPVIVQGESGCEKLNVACAVHFNDPSRQGAFIELDCQLFQNDVASFLSRFQDSVRRARAGSLLLSHIDQLPYSAQLQLADMMTDCSDDHDACGLRDVRVMVSTSQSLSQLTRDGRFSAALFTRLDFLTLVVPPLRDRPNDLAEIIERMIEQHKLFDDQYVEPIAKHFLCKYQWPGNYSELEKTLVQLLTFSKQNPVSIDDLNALTPHILGAPTPTEPSPLQSNLHRKLELQLHCVQLLHREDYEAFAHLHPGLVKALKYIGEQWQQDLSLTNVASNAFVSPSHLSYLFKKNLERSFKQILTELRIEKAKSKIEANPHIRITDLCLDVGFGDLSHFEKVFRRYTNETPREYKKRFHL